MNKPNHERPYDIIEFSHTINLGKVEDLNSIKWVLDSLKKDNLKKMIEWLEFDLYNLKEEYSKTEE